MYVVHAHESVETKSSMGEYIVDTFLGRYSFNKITTKSKILHKTI